LLEAGDTDAYRASTSQLAQLLAERLDHPERAQELLKEILEQDPTYVPAILALAAVYEARGEEGAMRLKLQQALQLGPKGSQGAQLHLKLAQLSMEDSERRREHLEQALQLDPTNMDVAKELLGLCRKLERWDQVAYLLELLAGRADEPERKRALVLERVDIMLDPIGDAAGVLRVLAPLYKEVQDDLEINRRIADALFVAERYDEAGGMYTWLIEVGRRSKRSKALGHHLTRMARIQLSNDDADGAKEQLLEAYRIDTTNTETLMTLGGLYERDEQWREALKIYRTMLLQNAEQTGLLRRGDIYINLARAHLALEEKPKAKAMLRRGLEEDHTHPELGMQLEAIED
jgi:Tfp pilus assembly protein PilF